MLNFGGAEVPSSNRAISRTLPFHPSKPSDGRNVCTVGRSRVKPPSSNLHTPDLSPNWPPPTISLQPALSEFLSDEPGGSATRVDTRGFHAHTPSTTQLGTPHWRASVIPRPPWTAGTAACSWDLSGTRSRTGDGGAERDGVGARWGLKCVGVGELPVG